MKNQSKRIFLVVSNLCIWSVLLLLWIYTWSTYYSDTISRPFGYKGNWMVFLLYGGINLLITHIYGGYKVGYYRQTEVFFSAIISLIFTNIISYIQVCLLGAIIMPLYPVIYGTIAGFFIIWLWVLVVHMSYQKLYPPFQLLMIYNGKPFADNLVNKIITRNDKYNISETIDVRKENMDYIYGRINNFNSIMLSNLESVLRNDLLKYCYEHDIRVYITPKLSDILIRNARSIELFDSPILLTEKHELTMIQKFGKRAMDIVISIIGIIVTSPLMLVIAVFIKAYDGGKVIYTQQRYTKNKQIFSIYKFRSMVIDADKIEGNRLAAENDFRITPIGSFIRRVRIDELPQLFNILRGEMSMVGPRPESPDIAEAYEKDIPEFVFRLKMKAGLTGYAQVVGKYNTTPYDKIKMDLMYITSYSLMMDLKIILMTFKVLFSRESTTGIENGKKDASLNKED